MGPRVMDPLAGLSTSIDPRQNLVPRLGILGVTLDQRGGELLYLAFTVE